MPIRLRGNLAKKETPTTGFDLIFRNSTVYNLDEIEALHNRSDSNAKLVIEVKDDKKITEEVVKEFNIELEGEISNVLNSNEVKEKLLSIVRSAMDEYVVYDTESDFFKKIVLLYISENVNKYLKSIYTKYNIDYTINIEGEKINVSYTINDKEKLNFAIIDVYDKYAAKYEAKLKDVDVGGLAISNRQIKVNISTDDYEKYLLSDEKSSSGFNQCPSEPGKRKPLIIWTDKTSDPNTGNNPGSLLDDIIMIKQKLQELMNKKTCDIPDIPSDDGEYLLKIIVDGDNYRYQWVDKYSEVKWNLLNNGSYELVVLGEVDTLSDESLNINLFDVRTHKKN